MKVSRRIKRSRLLINTGIQLIIACLTLVIIGTWFNMAWIAETAAIVAILVAIFTLFEYWSIRRFKKH